MTILFLCVLVVACKKKAATPATPTATPPPAAATMSSLDSCMLGDWALDSTQLYSNGYQGATLYNDPINCHLHLMSTPDTPIMRVGYYGLDCNNTITQWNITSGKLNVGGTLYQIISYSSTNLVILYGSTGMNGTGLKYHLHK